MSTQKLSAWNQGVLVGQKRPLKLKNIWSIRVRLEIADNTRNLALFDLALDSKLRGCDLVSIRVCDVSSGGLVSTRQYARIAKGWFSSIGLDVRDYGTHSLRRTKPSMIYKRTGNMRAIQLLLGHSKLESTVRYLGVDVEDALELSEQIEI